MTSIVLRHDRVPRPAQDEAPLGRADEVADAMAVLVGNALMTGLGLDGDGGLHLT